MIDDDLTVRTCPFCGTEPVVSKEEDDDLWFVGCESYECNATPSVGPYPNATKAVLAWNLRSPIPANIIAIDVRLIKAARKALSALSTYMIASTGEKTKRAHKELREALELYKD